MIAVGERLPDGDFKVKDGEGNVGEVSVASLFDGQRVVLIGVPGAFTSTCHNSHVPQFVQNVTPLKQRGADRIVVLSVNDHHVMRAWAEALEGAGKIDFVPDPLATYTRALGMDADMSGGGLGVRCKRFSALVDDRVVKTLNFEPEGSRGIAATGAATMLTQL